METNAYAQFLDNFGSEIGTTLEDLATSFNESEYDFADDVPSATYILKDSRSGSLPSDMSMDNLPGITDLSLKKARPLAFSNPVYHLLTADKVVAEPRKMKLIPLNQFEINKNHDEPTKKTKKGLMNKLSNLTIRRSNSTKKHEPEMQVTAPLWTDAPTVIPSEPRIRSRSFLPHTKDERFEEIPEKENENDEKVQNEEKYRPPKLDLAAAKESPEALKPPPIKTPRTSKGNVSPLDAPESIYKTETDPPGHDSDEISEDRLKVTGSTTSLISDTSEDCVDEDQTTKTMMEVLGEIDDDSANSEKASTDESTVQQSNDDEAENEAGEPRLKRNKTLKWSGSRAAPALIREFTRKSQKHNRQLQNAATESPELSATESPIKPSLPEEPGKLAPKSDGPKAVSPAVKKRDSSAFTMLSSLLPPAPKLRRSESSKIRMYIHKMGTNSHNALGYATTEFVKQTLHSSEHRPVVILHSIRSFLTDIKKYLITNPHVGLMPKIQKMIKTMQMSDIEGAIDDALERLVLYPLRDFIYKRLVLNYARSGKIKMIEDSIRIGETKSPRELGIRETLSPPDEEALELVQQHFHNLQSTYSPYYKLKHLLSAVTTIYQNTIDVACEDKSARKIGADDFLPLLVHSIVKCNFTSADIEAQYIDGLLDPSLLLGEGGYYLTTLISAVQVLASMKKRENPVPIVSDLQGFLKVGISPKVDGGNSILMHKTLHVPPSMSANNLGLMIAKKFGIKQAKSFCLHVVVNGVAYPLKPQEFPQLVKMDLMTQFAPGSFFFVYRQMENVKGPTINRPTTLDSEKLTVHTEDGEEEAVADGIEENGVTGQTQEEIEKKLLTLEVPPQTDDVYADGELSPGFSDIPLPDDVIIPQEETGDPPAGGLSHQESDIPEPHPPTPINEQDLPPPPDALQIEPDDVTQHEQSESKTDYVIADTVTPPTDNSNKSLITPSSETSINDDVTKQDSSLTKPGNDDVTMPDEFPTPISERPNEILLPEGKADTQVIITPPDPISLPLEEFPEAPGVGSPSNEEMPPPPDISTPGVNIIPPDGAVEPTQTYTDGANLSPGHQSHGGDTSDGEFLSDDDLLAEESYLQGTKVDDFVSPAKKTSPAAEAKRKVLLPPAVEEEELSITAQESSPSRSFLKISELDETRPGSSLSTTSSERGDRSYHSDDIPDDTLNQKQLDIGAQTSVSALKTYFESEIDKVTHHSPKKSSPN